MIPRKLAGMNPPLVILVTGLPATGKSRLAEALARRFGCPLLAKDAIKEPLLDVLGGGDRAWSRKLSDASFAVLFGLARAILATSRPLVVEGNFRAGVHEESLRPLVAAGPLIQFLCTAPDTARATRLAARATDATRHPGHDDAALLAEAPGNTGFLDLPGERITYDSTATDVDRVVRARFPQGE